LITTSAGFTRTALIWLVGGLNGKAGLVWLGLFYALLGHRDTLGITRLEMAQEVHFLYTDLLSQIGHFRMCRSLAH